MAVTDTARLLVGDPSGIGAARGLARRMSLRAGFDDRGSSEAQIVATELATNLVRHARRGSFAVHTAPGELTLATWDDGPGIADVEAAFSDGFSTSGGSGTGLGAIRRLSLSADVLSSRADGTVVLVRLGRSAPADRPGSTFSVGGWAIPMSGEGPCGDAFATRRDGDALTLVLADGLGHGPDAADAAQAALSCLPGPGDRSPAELLEAMHEQLRRTRGAAISIARLEPAAERVTFAGLGNVSGVVLTPTGRKTLLGHPGIVGREARRFEQHVHPLDPVATVLLHTDGVREGWTPERHPGVLREEPLVVASAVIRDAERGRDDVGVLVARARPGVR